MRSADEIEVEVSITEDHLVALKRELIQVSTVAFVAIVNLDDRIYQVGRISSRTANTAGEFTLKWLAGSNQGHIHYNTDIGGFNVLIGFGETAESAPEDPRKLLFHMSHTRDAAVRWAQDKLAS